MIISELSYLEEIIEDSIITGGACSLTASLVNGKATAKSSGCPLQKKVIKKGSSTTYIFTAGNNRATLTSGKADVKDVKPVLSASIARIDSLIEQLL